MPTYYYDGKGSWYQQVGWYQPASVQAKREELIRTNFICDEAKVILASIWESEYGEQHLQPEDGEEVKHHSGSVMGDQD